MLTAVDADMFLGVFPGWVGDLLSILGAPAILLAIVVWILGRRDANRKLIVDEGTLKKSEFDSYTAAQDRALERAAEEVREAKQDAREANDHADRLDEAFDIMRESFFSFRTLFRKVLARAGIEMTPEELKEFEAHKPVPRPSRIRPASTK